MNKIATLFLFSILYFPTFSQSVLEKFEEYQNSHHLEKVYISHDKSFYTPGDTIWCMSFFVDGKTHQFFDNARPLIHIEWYNPKDKLSKKWTLKTEEGTSFFEIPLSYDIAPGTYTLKAYTQYQRNFEDEYIFQKEIDIISDSSQEESKYIDEADPLKFDIKFYPEGGQIIEGLKNRVAFKVQNERGENLNIEGSVTDEDDEVITSFKTYHEGIGYFDFIPKPNKKYTVTARNQGIQKSFLLPKRMDKGFVLAVDGKSKEFIIVQVQSNGDKELAGSTLLGHVRGIPFLNQTFDGESLKYLKIARTDIPSGIVHFTLFNDQGLPVCERLTFNKNSNENVSIQIETEKESYTKRELVNVGITTNTEMVTPSKMSVAAYNSDLNPTLTSAVTIENYLLLLSDLKGRINSPDQYFSDNSSKTNFFLDLLMMTHGWRKFKWMDILNNTFPSLEFGTQEDYSIVGIVKKKNQEEGMKADVFVTTLDDKGFSTTNLTSDENGVFYLRGFDFKDTVDIIIQASKYDPDQKNREKGVVKRGKKSNVDIEILQLEDEEFDSKFSISSTNSTESEKNELITNFKENRKLDSLYNPTWALEMDEFFVKSKRKTERQQKEDYLKQKMKERGMFYFPSSQKIFLDDLPGGGYQYNNIFDIVRDRAPSVQVKGSGPDRIFVVRATTNLQGDIPALVLLDGMQIARPGDIFVTPDNILAIDVVRGLSSTSVFGEAGAGGVVSIITKDPLDVKGSAPPRITKGSVKIQYPGFYAGREYYSPNYNIKSIYHQRPDLRTTLFWKPDISMKSNSTEFSFHVGDKIGNYLIVLEGITEDGVPFVKRKSFKVVE